MTRLVSSIFANRRLRTKEMRGGPGGKWQLCERSRGQSGGQDGGDFFAA
jgi:hypothetical protein